MDMGCCNSEFHALCDRQTSVATLIKYIYIYCYCYCYCARYKNNDKQTKQTKHAVHYGLSLMRLTNYCNRQNIVLLGFI